MSLTDLRAVAEELQARVKAREQDVAAEMQRLREWEENPLPGAEKEFPMEEPSPTKTTTQETDNT